MNEPVLIKKVASLSIHGRSNEFYTPSTGVSVLLRVPPTRGGLTRTRKLDLGLSGRD